MAPPQDGRDDDAGAHRSGPTPRELRAARRRAHEHEKHERAGAGAAGKGGKGGKGGKMGKGGGSEDATADDRRRR